MVPFHPPPPSYASFQISDGTAGDAQAKANAVFVDPFAGVDLATLDDAVAKNMNTMREAAETAETAQFNPAIAAASGAAADGGADMVVGGKRRQVRVSGKEGVGIVASRRIKPSIPTCALQLPGS